MKRTWMAVMVALAVVALVGTAQAYQIKLDTITTTTPSNYYYPGGPFKATVFSPVPAGLLGAPSGTGGDIEFLTFCLEKVEYFTPGVTYNFDNLSNQAFNGGVAGGNPDPLDARTAWLYYNFRTDASFAVDQEHKMALQLAIWHIEQEAYLPTPTPLMSLEQTYAWEYVNNSDGQWTDIGSVRVLNLYSGTTQAQSQLGLMSVPEPGTLLLLGSGLLGVTVLRRRIG